MGLLSQQIMSGIASGAIYGSLALALVLVYRSTGLINFAQGEMALVSTYITWQFVQFDMPIYLAIALSMLIAVPFGMGVERFLIHPVEHAPHLVVVIVMVGMFYFFNGAVGWIWGHVPLSVPSMFPSGRLLLGEVRFSFSALGVLATLLVVMAVLYWFFTRTRIGLVLRATASNQSSARLVGIRVDRMLMLSWGVAAAVGALAGALIAPRLVLDPSMMLPVLIYAFAGATLGGFDSPGGAVLGGMLVGVIENLAGTYIGFIGAELKIVVPLIVIIAVLMVRPTGLFGRSAVVRA